MKIKFILWVKYSLGFIHRKKNREKFRDGKALSVNREWEKDTFDSEKWLSWKKRMKKIAAKCQNICESQMAREISCSFFFSISFLYISHWDQRSEINIQTIFFESWKNMIKKIVVLFHWNWWSVFGIYSFYFHRINFVVSFLVTTSGVREENSST